MEMTHSKIISTIELYFWKTITPLMTRSTYLQRGIRYCYLIVAKDSWPQFVCKAVLIGGAAFFCGILLTLIV